MRFGPAVALAAILAAAVALPAATACETVSYQTVSYQTCEPATNVWISGHYEWRGGDYAYVPGHWVVQPQRCTTTVVDGYGQAVVYAAPPPPCPERVVVVQHPPIRRHCEPEPVYRRSCPPPQSHTEVHVAAPVLPLPVPVPVPFPFPFFKHH